MAQDASAKLHCAEVVGKDGTAAGGGINSVSPTIKVLTSNYIITTTIIIDIAARSGESDAIVSSGSSGNVIGESGEANAYLTRITNAVNGFVYGGRIICVETPTTGDNDINVCANSSQLAEGAAGEGEHVLADCGTQTSGTHTEFTIPSGGIDNDYIYLTHGTGATGTYNAGKFVLIFYGTNF